MPHVRPTYDPLNLAKVEASGTKLSRRAIGWLISAEPFQLIGANLFPAGMTIQTYQPESRGGANFHQHDYIQIQLVLSGRFTFNNRAGEEFVLRAGDGLIIPAGVLHRWECGEGGVLIGANVRPDGDRSGELHRQLAAWCPHGVRAFQDGASQMVDLLIEVLLSGRATDDQTFNPLVVAWLSYNVSRTFPVHRWSSSRPEMRTVREIVHKAKSYLRHNFEHRIHLQDVASEVGVSVRHLNRLFMKHEQMPPTAFLLDLRLRRAASLLRQNPNQPIKATAFDSGFCSHAYFTARFKRRFGTTPTRFVGEGLQR